MDGVFLHDTLAQCSQWMRTRSTSVKTLVVHCVNATTSEDKNSPFEPLFLVSLCVSSVQFSIFTHFGHSRYYVV